MSGINKVTLVGHLGKAPELRYLGDGSACASFSIATSDVWKDKQTGEKKERTEWHRIVAWRKLGEFVGEYIGKGRLVYIEGKLQTRKWEKDGVTHYTTEIVASTVQPLTGAGNADRDNSHGSGSDQDQVTGDQTPEDDIPF
ncbi:MAG: single-stranded DNA-binding protein [Desulfobacteraceae bacterium]|nr:single-stranded DNA-binding protein [Desulfobacteraceae bacterium]